MLCVYVGMSKRQFSVLFLALRYSIPYQCTHCRRYEMEYCSQLDWKRKRFTFFFFLVLNWIATSIRTYQWITARLIHYDALLSNFLEKHTLFLFFYCFPASQYWVWASSFDCSYIHSFVFLHFFPYSIWFSIFEIYTNYKTLHMDLWSCVWAFSGSINRKGEICKGAAAETVGKIKEEKKKHTHKYTVGTYPCDDVETEYGIFNAWYLIFQFDHVGPLTISFSCHVSSTLSTSVRSFVIFFFVVILVHLLVCLFFTRSLCCRSFTLATLLRLLPNKKKTLFCRWNSVNFFTIATTTNFSCKVRNTLKKNISGQSDNTQYRKIDLLNYWII